MKRILVTRILLILVALIAATGAGASGPAFAGSANAQGQRVVESRVVHVQGNQVMLHDGTTLTIPRYVADPTEIQGGDTVKFTYEVKNGRNIATSIRFIDRPGGGLRRW